MQNCLSLSRLVRTVLPGLAACMLFAGCQTLSPSTQAASDQWRMASLEENFLEFKESQKEESTKAAQNEEMLKARMMALEESMAALRSEMAETREALKQSSVQPMSSMKTEPVMGGAESSEEKPWANVPQPGVKDTPKVASKTAPAKPKPQAASASTVSGAAALYEKGQQLAAAEKAEQAREVLDSFLAKYPNDKLVPNALYWKGETYYAQKDYPQAILAFKDVTQRFPKHAKAQAALLKIGMSYKNVGDADNAVFYLRTLVDEHPGSEPAKLARKLLEEIPG